MVDQCEACLARLFKDCDLEPEDCLGPFYTVAAWETTLDGGV